MPYFLTFEKGSPHHNIKGRFNRIVDEHPLIWLANKRNERPDWTLALLFWSEVPDGVAEESRRIEREQRHRLARRATVSAGETAPAQEVSLLARILDEYGL